MKTGIIYLATNILNNKKYVGQTYTSLGYRQSQHFNNAFKFNRDSKFCQALRKYGKEGFTWSILEYDVLETILDDREIYWIAYFDSFNNGYNMTEGGHTIKGYRHTQETKDKIKTTMQGKSNKDHFIKRYGEEKGNEMYNQYIESMKNRKGKNRLDVLIDKYGEVEGRLKYNNMVDKIKEARKRKGSTNTLDKFIEKYGEEEGKIKHEEFSNKMKAIKRSDEFIEKLKNRKFSEETLEKMRKSHKGLKKSEEHINNWKRSRFK